MKSLLFISLVFLTIPLRSFADSGTPPLERTVTFQVKNERIENILKEISKQGDLTFSYDPAVIQADKIVETLSITRKTVREALNQLFRGAIQYKQRGKYIILTPAPTAQRERVVEGYITNDLGEKLKDVSIYDPVSLKSTVTDEYGYFALELDKSATDITLIVNKQRYADTTFIVAPDEVKILKIPIRTEKITTMADSLGQKVKRFWQKSITSIQSINMINITDTLHRQVQFSVLPFIGTNHKLSGNVINNYSVNMLGGYSLGVEKLEVGGLFNSVRGDVHGVQAAGLFNAVAEDVEGVQFAGLFNATRGKSKSAAFAGMINFTWGESESVDFAGLINYNQKDARAVKFAGLANASLGKLNGFQTAGLVNFVLRDVKGGQLAGFANAAIDTIRGVQIAGLLNLGVKYVRGAQISGLMNVARNLHGVQVGVINIADSVSGVQFGFLSFAWKGYHTIEVFADEVFYANVALRTGGTRGFYNILTVGAKPDTFENEETMWSFGYGIGTLPRLGKKLYLNFDLTANQIVKGKIDEVNLLNKLYVGADYRIAKKLSFTAGATLNAYVTKTDYDFYPPLFSDYVPSVRTSVSGDYQWQWWVGAKVGVRFL